jgi:hypothetical protein
MGGAGSTLALSKKLTGKDLKNSSNDIKLMSNALFEFMYSNWKPRDVWEIANNPSAYVIAMSDLITTQFHVLGYKTKSGKLGEIYFKKWDDLEPPLASSDKISEANARNLRLRTNTRNARNSNRNLQVRHETRRLRSEKGYAIQKQNAEIIAFYFIRIFQILGALLLVVKDANIPEFDPITGEIKSEKELSEERAYAQQSYPIQQTVSGFKPVKLPVTRGGSMILFDSSKPLGPYEFLRFYLRQINDADLKKFTDKGISNIDRKNTYMFDGSDVLFFRYTIPDNASEISKDIGGKQELGIAVTIDGVKKIEYISIKISEIIFDTEESDRFRAGYKAPKDIDEKNRKLIFPSSVNVEYIKNSWVTIQRIPELSSSISNGTEYKLYRDDKGLVDIYTSSLQLDKRRDFTKFLEFITLYYLRKANGNLVPIKFEKKQASSNSDEDSKYKIKPPSNGSLKDAYNEFYTNKNYRPHCISRALQLLDPASINNFPTGSGVTSVCVTSLGESKGQTSLSEYKATRTLGQLFGKINPLDYAKSEEILKAFVQVDSKGEPLSVSGLSNNPTEAEELSRAIEKLSTAFNIVFKDQTSFSDLTVDVPTACKDNKGKQIPIDRRSQVFKEMKSASQELLSYHLKSIIDISKFLQKIFNITQRPNGTWAVEGPKTELMFAGFEALNALTDTARAILINYYSGCEEIYQKGLKAWKSTIPTEIDAIKELPN